MTTPHRHVPTICFVSYEIHPVVRGGCGVLVHHAANALLEAGHEVVLLLDIAADLVSRFNDVDRLTMSRPDRIRAYGVDELCADRAPPRDFVPDVVQWCSLRFALALDELRGRRDLDFVEFFDYCGPGYYAMVKALFAPGEGDARPVMGVRMHGSLEVIERFGDGSARDRIQLSQFAFERAAMALAETVLTPSRTFHESYCRDLYRLPASCVVVSSPPRRPLVRSDSSPDGDESSIVFLGRLFHLKGTDQLVEAAVTLMRTRPDLRFRVELVGRDDDQTPFPAAGPTYGAYLRSLLPHRFRDRFVFHGQVPHAQVARLLGRATFAVFPNRVESFCYALHEAYDAGVPVVVNALPAFADFFVHERNCLVYDGTTSALVACMSRMLDDAPLRASLARPYPVADLPFGDFYERPVALRPLVTTRTASPVAMVVVVCDRDDETLDPSIALTLRDSVAHRVVLLSPAPVDAEGTVRLLGASWRCRSSDGTPLEPGDILTDDAMLVMRASDRLAPDWLPSCIRALARRSCIGFAGTWSMVNGRLEPSQLDLLPALAPFDTPGRLHRVLFRTPSGRMLRDLFDATLGPLGHVGAVLDAVAKHGRGVLLPEPLIEISDPDPLHPDASHLKALVMRVGHHFADSLTLLTPFVVERLALAHDEVDRLRAALIPPPPSPPSLDLEDKLRIADQLGGRSLAKLALRKLAKRLRGR